MQTGTARGLMHDPITAGMHGGSGHTAAPGLHQPDLRTPSQRRDERERLCLDFPVHRSGRQQPELHFALHTHGGAAKPSSVAPGSDLPPSGRNTGAPLYCYPRRSDAHQHSQWTGSPAVAEVQPAAFWCTALRPAVGVRASPAPHQQSQPPTDCMGSPPSRQQIMAAAGWWTHEKAATGEQRVA